MSQTLNFLRMAALAAAIVLAGSPARAWGPIAHQTVNAHAIDTLPKGLKPFYKNHRLEMPSLSPEAGVPVSGVGRRLAGDPPLCFPVAAVPHTEAAPEGEVRQAGGEVRARSLP